LTLFDAMASDWGVQSVDGGKIVWFELPVDFPAMPHDLSDGSFRFDLSGVAHPVLHEELDDSPVILVRLKGIPVALLQKASEEYEALFRELRLMKEHSSATRTSLPDRLAVLVSQMGTRFNGLGPGMDETWQSAVDEKVESYDWVLPLSQSAVVACEFYDAILDELDEFAVSARLLTLPTSAESQAVRRWFLSELIGQLHGKAPVPWVDSRFYDSLQAATAG
jgi:hypothetical protein